jgi:CheY-like chemotaxis protein
MRSPDPSGHPRILLLDDDPVFCRLMERSARGLGVPLAVCSRLAELGEQESHHDFDAAVVDYYLEDMTGPQIVALLHERPFLLVSQDDNCLGGNAALPEGIHTFLPKRAGPRAILKAAVALGRKEAL